MTHRRLVASLMFVSLIAIAATGCDASISLGSGTSGSGDLVAETYDLAGFDSIEVSGSFDARVTVGGGFSVQVLADDNLIDDLDIVVRGNELRIGTKGGFSLKSGTLEATVTLPDLAAVEASGATNVNVFGVAASDLDIEASGASDLIIEGSATSVTLDANGSSTVDLQLSSVDELKVELNGASSVDVESANTISGELNGASDLSVPSGSDLDVSTSGASSIDRG